MRSDYAQKTADSQITVAFGHRFAAPQIRKGTEKLGFSKDYSKQLSIRCRLSSQGLVGMN